MATGFAISLGLLILVLLPLSLVVALLTYAARRATRFVGICRRCGYDLRGLAAHADRRHCPECGQRFLIDKHGRAVS